MGFFDFVKDAGQKIFGGEEEEKETPRAESSPPPSPEEERKAADRRRAAALVKFVDGMGFELAEFSIKVEGETATVKGRVPNQEVKEKVVLAVGNTSGISKVDDQLEVGDAAAQPAGEAVFYTVKRGDTLSAIAKVHYGNANKYMVIFEANKPMLQDPDKIYPGQVLRIPPRG